MSHGFNNIYTTESTLQGLTPNFHQKFETYHQKIARDQPNGPLYPLIQLLFEQLNQSSKTLPPNLDGSYFNKYNVSTKTIQDSHNINFPNDVYKSMYVESPSSSTSKTNANKNQK